MKYFLALFALLAANATQAQDNNPQYISLANNQLPQSNNWTYFTGRYDVTVNTGDQQIPATLNLRMKRDSIVWFSISANMGIQIQVAKGIMLRDTLHLADIYHKEYYAIPVAEASKYLSIPLGVQHLQHLFVGQPLVDTCSPQPVNNSNYSVKLLNQLMCYTTVAQPLVIESKFAQPTAETKKEYDGFSQLRFTEITTPDKPKDKVVLEHNQWLDVSKESGSAFSFLPMAMKITSTTAQQTAQVDLALTTARYDVIPSYPFKIDDSYKRQTLPLK
jgi:hypothetical protein